MLAQIEEKNKYEPNIVVALLLYISTIDFVYINQKLINYISKLNIDSIILNKQLNIYLYFILLIFNINFIYIIETNSKRS